MTDQVSELLQTKHYKDGEPCGHPGCLSHRTHPCEVCGRIGGIKFTRNYIQEIAWRKGITYAETNENYEQGAGLLCWNCGRFTPTNKKFTEWTCPACLFEHRLDQASRLQQELEKYAPDVKWNVTPYDKFSILIMWEREIGERLLTGEGEIDVALLKPGIEKVAQSIAGQVSRIQPTGKDIH